MSDNKNFEIQSIDEYRLNDSINSKNREKKYRPRGYVYVYSTDVNDPSSKQLISENKVDPVDDDENLIVYSGREWVASRIFNVDNSNITPSSNGFLYWIGVGTGGAVSGDIFTPESPTNSDTDLDNPIPISADNTDYADERYDGYYKKPYEAIDFQQDEENDDAWLVVKITVVLTGSDANSADPLNEAGIYIAESNSPGFTGPFTLFSRVTFSSIQKDSTRQLTLVWYIYV